MRIEVKCALDEIDACKELRKKTKDQKIKAKYNTTIKKWNDYLKQIGYSKKELYGRNKRQIIRNSIT